MPWALPFSRLHTPFDAVLPLFASHKKLVFLDIEQHNQADFCAIYCTLELEALDFPALAVYPSVNQETSIDHPPVFAYR